MPRITISYRRDDSGVITGRIFDRLATHYGRDAVFRDIDNIPPGVDFRKHIDEVLESSDIILAIVGSKWIGPRATHNRLANAADPVRLEIETVLRKGKPLIPILVQRANMPRVEQLPESLKDFAYRNAVDIDAGRDFDHHMERLIRAMDLMLGAAAGSTASRERGFGDGSSYSPGAKVDDYAHHDSYLALEAELTTLREANHHLETRVAKTAEAAAVESRNAEKLRQELSEISLHHEQQEKELTQRLATVRDAAEAQKIEDRRLLLKERQAKDEALVTVSGRADQLAAAERDLAQLRSALKAYETTTKKQEEEALKQTHDAEKVRQELSTVLLRHEQQEKELSLKLAQHKELTQSLATIRAAAEAQKTEDRRLLLLERQAKDEALATVSQRADQLAAAERNLIQLRSALMAYESTSKQQEEEVKAKRILRASAYKEILCFIGVLVVLTIILLATRQAPIPGH